MKRAWLLICVIVLVGDPVLAQGLDGGFPVTFGGYAEAHYQWNFNAPANGVSNYRVVDNRHNTFTVPNVSLSGTLDSWNVVARVALQVGHTPATYFGAEPTLPGAAGANETSPQLWQFVQEAYAGYRFPLGSGLLVRAGVFLSPIGPESVPIKDNWNWSRSNLFFALPFYHTGLELSYRVTPRWTLAVSALNGWNSIVDGNDEKSLMVHAQYDGERVEASFVYFTGVERPRGAPEGRPWRHLFDADATWAVTPWLSVLGHLNGGFESHRLGVSAWGAGALSVRARPHELVFVALRGDVFVEHTPSGASPIFWPAPWVSSGTATVELRPQEHVSFRLEYRHDEAGAPLYFGADPVRETAVRQDTLTLGVFAWF